MDELLVNANDLLSSATAKFIELGELREFNSSSTTEWFVKFRNPFGESGQLAWEPTFLGNELEVLTVAFLCFIHAYRHGGRYLWLWFTTIAHGITVELVSYWVEPIDNFWHAQSTFMFFGQREPIHVFFLYPSFIYPASIAVQRLGLSELTEACTTGLLVVLFDMPYDIMGIKLLWWTWHDTDANIRDRHYWVPWNSYMFHATFACAFSLIYNKTRRYFVGTSGLYSASDIERMPYAQQLIARNWKGDLKALLVTGACAMPFGIVQFVPSWHIFGDIFGVHAEVTFSILAMLYGTIILYGIQHATPRNMREEGEREENKGVKRTGKGRWYLDEVYLAVLVHFAFYICIVIFSNPADVQALGLHQHQGSPSGSGDEFDCGAMRNLTYPYPFTKSAFPDFLKGDLPDVMVWKRPYLCEDGSLLDEKVMDYSCPEAKAQTWTPDNQWFWVCGTGWDNQGTGTSHVEYMLVVIGVCCVGILTFTNAMCYPRNLWEQFAELKEFPRYYLTSAPSAVVTEIKESRAGENGRREYLVSKQPLDGGCKMADKWEAGNELEQDGVGARYAEGGGQYGVFYDSHGGSTRDRLRGFETRKNAIERIQMFENGAQRRRVTGIAYKSGVPCAAKA